MKVKTCLKTAGSACATGASVAIGVQGARNFTSAESTKSKIIAGLEMVAGAAGTVYAGFQTFRNAKDLASGIKMSKNSPEAVAKNIQ